MTSIRRALAFSFGERYALIVISLLSNVLLARLLTPTEIGLYSVSLAVIGMAHMLRDFGIGSFLIQERSLTEQHIRTAFGFALIIGGTLFTALELLAPLVARFYESPALTNVMRVSALNFLVLPFCSISMSLLRRQMLFKRLLMVNLAAAIVGFSSTIYLAYLDYGPISMAIGAVLGNICTGVAAWIARDDRQLLLPSLSEWRTVLRFGGQSSLANLLGTVSADANDLFVGKMLGFAPVALISRGQGLMNFFHRDIMAAVRNVGQPAFARAFREGADLEPMFRHAVGLLTAAAWPFYAFLATFPLEILRLLFGHQWDAAAPLVPWFCAAGALAGLNSLISTLLIARGEVNLVLRLQLIIDPLRLLSIFVALAVAPQMLTFAIVFMVFYGLSVPIAYVLKDRVQKTDYRSLTRVLAKSAVVALIPGAIVWVAATTIRQGQSVTSTPQMLSLAVAMMALWALSLFAVRHPFIHEPALARAIAFARRSARRVMSLGTHKP